MLEIVGCIEFIRLHFIEFNVFLLGARNVDNCPAQDLIPTFLIVMGTMLLVSVPLIAVPWCLYQCSHEDNSAVGCLFCIMICLFSLIPCFTSVWFICGNVWVFSIYQPSYNILNGSYCDEVTYKFSVAVIIFTWLSPFLSCCCNFCLSCNSVE